MVVDIVFGFLGAGKTTFITKVLSEWGSREKIVVLVNEFGEIGIDGTLLEDWGANVVEMPSGCICCTLQADFRSQLQDIFKTFNPERVIIEPTGVATIAQVQTILQAQIFEDAIQVVHAVLVADATGFMDLYKANPHFVESQVRHARIVLLNKCDRVDPRRAMLIRDAISAINPDATVLMTEYGAVDWGRYNLALTTPIGSSFQDAVPDQLFQTHEQQDGLGYESLGLVYESLTFDHQALKDLLEQLKDSRMGEIARVKGFFRLEDKWVLMELASGEFFSQAVKEAEKSKVSIIGRGLKRQDIGAAFEKCIIRRT